MEKALTILCLADRSFVGTSSERLQNTAPSRAAVLGKMVRHSTDTEAVLLGFEAEANDALIIRRQGVGSLLRTFHRVDVRGKFNDGQLCHDFKQEVIALACFYTI